MRYFQNCPFGRVLPSLRTDQSVCCDFTIDMAEMEKRETFN